MSQKVENLSWWQQLLIVAAVGTICLGFVFPLRKQAKGTTTAVAKATPSVSVLTNNRLDKTLNRRFAQHDAAMAQPSHGYVPATPQEKAVVAAKRTKEQTELTRLMKISKPIPMKLVSGTMPLTASYQSPPLGKSYNEAIYDLREQYQITSYSFGLTCSGPILTTCHWYLSTSKNKKEWELVADGDSQSNISHSGDRAVVSGKIFSTARYIKWRVKAEGTMMPGLYTLTISDPRLEGIKTKMEVK